MTDADKESLKSTLGRIAKDVSELSNEKLDETFSKVDASNFATCPSCGKQPNVWKSKDERVGVIRCCGKKDVVLVTIEPNRISNFALDKWWRKITEGIERSNI